MITRLKLANRHARSLAVCSNLEDRHANDDIDAWTKRRFLEGQVAACVSYGWRIILLVVGDLGFQRFGAAAFGLYHFKDRPAMV